MTEQAKQDEAKGPEVTVKKAPSKAKAKPEPKAKPTLTAATKKQLEELAHRIAEVDKLKAERLAILKKEHGRGVATSELSAASTLSVPRLRQLLAK